MNLTTRLYREIRSRLRPMRGGARNLGGALLREWVDASWPPKIAAVPHGLPRPLIVSLTSYPPRYPTLALTLKCLLRQSVKADRIILWIAEADYAALPPEVLALQRHGLQIETCEDLRSFKKIVPTLNLFPHAFIVTADDDVFYARTWLAELISGYTPGQREIPGHRIHRLTFTRDGALLPYAKWRFDIKRGPASPRNFPTGIGGALYPPGCLHPDVTDVSLFRDLAPTSDDAWLYWMARRQGWSFRKVGPRRLFVSWPGSQKVALQHENVAHANDAQIARLTERYGLPLDLTPRPKQEPARVGALAET